MKNLLTALACLISVNMLSQSILIDQPYCDLGGKREHIMQVMTNFDDRIMVSRRSSYNNIMEIVQLNELENHCKNHILKNNDRSVFVIRYDKKSNTTELILEQVKSVYKSLNIAVNDWKICCVSYDEDLNQPPPPPPPPPGLIDPPPFMIVVNMPVLGSCKDLIEYGSRYEVEECTKIEIIKFISNNSNYPANAKANGIKGTVFVYFVVGKDGNVKDVRVLREVHPELDKEAKRVVESLPKFEPGRQSGKNVNVQYTVPVQFKLNEDKKVVE